uniref:Uncharacterized protein n=1 Tax=Anguilla anguilla TaxID=7936 RepID=A0A0E9VLV7_ANGAN
MSIIMVQLRNSLGKQIKQCSSQIFDSPMWLTETCFRVCGKKSGKDHTRDPKIGPNNQAGGIFADLCKMAYLI